MFLGLCRIGRKSYLRRCPTHFQKPVSMMAFPMIMLFRCIKASKQVVRSYPSIQTLRLPRYRLYVQITIWELEIRR